MTGPALRAVVAVVAAAFAAPFVYLALRNATHAGEFWAAVSESRALGALGRSVLLATCVAAAAAVVGAASAWAVVRTDVPARRLWRVLLPLPLVIPSFIGAFALIAAFARGGLVDRLVGVHGLPVSGFAGAFLVLTVLTYPYVYLPVEARLRRLPRSFEESSRLLGRRGPATFLRVVLPQLRGAILAGTMLVFLYTISDFGAVQLLRYDTLTRSIYANRLLDQPLSLALSLVLGLLALVVVAGERVLRGRATHVESTRGSEPLVLELGRARWPVVALLALPVLVGLVAPTAVLVYWTTRGSGLDFGGLVEPALSTAGVSLAAAALSLAVVLPVAQLTVRHRSRLGEVANAVVVAGFALPGLAVALALVFWTIDAPRPISSAYQTLPLLVFAYVVHFGAQALRTAQVAVAGVPPSLDEAARSLGAGRRRRWLRVELPLATPALLAGGGLVLLSTMKELPVTLLLAPSGFQTLATKVWVSTEDAFFADASAAALVLIALSAVLTWLLVLRTDAAR
jgi:iron(III) transport system permease protein